MKELLASEAGLLDACLESFRSFPVVMLQFPEVFALMAPPNQQGVDALNRVKKRLPEKFYSTLVGEDAHFLHLTDYLPEYLPRDQAGSLLEGSIMRIRVADVDKNSPVCFAGTHQGLVYRQGYLRELFKALEKAFKPIAEPGFHFGKNYSAPLCTSANISGHPDGSITDLTTARRFAESAGIPLLIRSAEPDANEKGSYPVLIPEKDHIRVERNGPGLSEIMQRFPDGLFRY